MDQINQEWDRPVPAVLSGWIQVSARLLLRIRQQQWKPLWIAARRQEVRCLVAFGAPGPPSAEHVRQNRSAARRVQAGHSQSRVAPEFSGCGEINQSVFK